MQKLIKLMLRKVNVHEIVSNIIAIIHIPENGVVKIQGQLPVIKGDRFRLQQLFQNLIETLNHNDKTVL
jgi:light-regulated signal transduction histidine kinase (bacteriophytochrome)